MIRLKSYGMNIGFSGSHHFRNCWWENENLLKLDYRKHDGYFWVIHLGNNDIALIRARPRKVSNDDQYRYCADEGNKGINCNRYWIAKWEKFKLYNLNCSRDNANIIQYNPEIGSCTKEDNHEFSHEWRKPFYLKMGKDVPLKKENAIRYDPAPWGDTNISIMNRLTGNKGRQMFYIALRGGKDNKLCYLNTNGNIDHFKDGTKLTCNYEEEINLNDKDICSLSSHFKNINQNVTNNEVSNQSNVNSDDTSEVPNGTSPTENSGNIQTNQVTNESNQSGTVNLLEPKKSIYPESNSVGQNNLGTGQPSNMESTNDYRINQENNGIFEQFQTPQDDINTCFFSKDRRKNYPYILSLEIIGGKYLDDENIKLPHEIIKEERIHDKPKCCFNTNGLKRNIKGC